MLLEHERSVLPNRNMLRSGRALLVVTFCVVTIVACKKKRPQDEPELPTVAGDGVTSSQSRTLPPFTRLEVDGALDVTVNVGKDSLLELHGDANLFPHVGSSVVNGELKLEPDAVLKPAQKLTLSLGVARLDYVAAGIAAKVAVHGVKTEAFSVRTGGAAQLTVDGSSSELSVGARSVSRVDLGTFSAAHARVSALEFARVELGYLEKLDADQRGMAIITYRGTPAVTTHADRAENVASRH